MAAQVQKLRGVSSVMTSIVAVVSGNEARDGGGGGGSVDNGWVRLSRGRYASLVTPGVYRHHDPETEVRPHLHHHTTDSVGRTRKGRDRQCYKWDGSTPATNAEVTEPSYAHVCPTGAPP
jgi:hypothetical protein